MAATTPAPSESGTQLPYLNTFGGSTSISFSPDTDIPALTAKVILVTGGSNGLGKESILQLAKHEPANIWMGARNAERAQTAIDDILEEIPNSVSIKFLHMDLGSFASISEAATTFRKQSSRLDILMLNAGIMITPAGLTEDGYEIQFAALPDSDVRVVILSSEAHNMAPSEGILWETLKTEANGITTRTRYGQSKLGNILYARELTKRHPQIKAVSVHPGMVKANLGNESAIMIPIGAMAKMK
ncbi:hypothetical protein FOBRF1_007497 [Fusarium oxysporum]